jgi:hypothetical protein
VVQSNVGLGLITSLGLDFTESLLDFGIFLLSVAGVLVLGD